MVVNHVITRNQELASSGLKQVQDTILYLPLRPALAVYVPLCSSSLVPSRFFFFKMLRLLTLAVLLVGIQGQGEVDPKLDMYGIINVLYLKADKDMNGMISEPELADVYHGFDSNGDGRVTKTEFVTLWQSITHGNQEHAEAFFYLADLNDDNIIDSKDLSPLYNVFDTDGDGQVTAHEFAEKWVGIILEAPLAVLFERSDANRDNVLTHNEFSKFFSSFDTNGDHSVTLSEFEQGMVSSSFGTTAEADALFKALDTDHDGRITASHDLNSRFTSLDINHDHHLIILEVVKLAAYLPKPSLQG